MVAIRSWISRKLSHEGIFFYAYLERAYRNWPNNEFSWKNQLAIPTVSYSLKQWSIKFWKWTYSFGDPQAYLFLSGEIITNLGSAHLSSQADICVYNLLRKYHCKMANTQVRVELIYHARGHYLAVAGYRYIVKTRKQGRDAELIYWKCTEKDYARHRKYQRQFSYQVS